VGLVVGQPFGRRQRVRRGFVFEDLIQDRDDVVAFHREHRFQIGELPPAMGQAMAADQGVAVVRWLAPARRHHDRFGPIRLASPQQRAQVIARVRPARVIQADDAFADLHHQAGGVHPRRSSGAPVASARWFSASSARIRTWVSS